MNNVGCWIGEVDFFKQVLFGRGQQRIEIIPTPSYFDEEEDEYLAPEHQIGSLHSRVDESSMMQPVPSSKYHHDFGLNQGLKNTFCRMDSFFLSYLSRYFFFLFLDQAPIWDAHAYDDESEDDVRLF